MVPTGPKRCIHGRAPLGFCREILMHCRLFVKHIRLLDVFMYFSGCWLTYPPEKYESQLELLFPIYGKIKNGSKPPSSFVLYVVLKTEKKKTFVGLLFPCKIWLLVLCNELNNSKYICLKKVSGQNVIMRLKKKQPHL